MIRESTGMDPWVANTARVRERLEDLKLDVPQAEQRFVECEQKAREVGWLV